MPHSLVARHRGLSWESPSTDKRLQNHKDMQDAEKKISSVAFPALNPASNNATLLDKNMLTSSTGGECHGEGCHQILSDLQARQKGIHTLYCKLDQKPAGVEVIGSGR